jgi:ribonuclease BN (tRNA processing enzyme)
MELTVLGAGTCVPVEGYSPAGYVLRRAEEVVLIDAGPGTLARLERVGIRYRDLKLVLFTHLHPDHTLDLVTLLQANNATPGWKRSESLQVAGPRGMRRFLERLYQVFEGIAPEAYEIRVDELAESQHDIGGWHLATGLTGHTPNSLAYRVEAEGRTVVFSGDAAAVEPLARLAQGADLLVCECSFPQGWPTSDHLTAGQAGQAAQAAGVKRLLLTHLYPPALAQDPARQAQAIFTGKVDLARDGYATDV